MEKRPLEVFQQIFRLAYRDGGQTGRSLSRVSKYVRDASAGARYISVTIRGYDQLLAFGDTITRYGAEIINLQHLFLSMGEETETYSRLDATIELIYQLLCDPHVATVKSLCIHLRRDLISMSTKTSPGLLPAIEDFVFVIDEGYLPIRRRSLNDIMALPSIRRLHLATPDRLWHLLRIAGLSPHLAHLRLS